jgi:hypothetical protein
MLLLIPGFGGGDLDELCRSSAGEPVGLRSGSRFYRLQVRPSGSQSD